jgi:hypothetical protein
MCQVHVRLCISNAEEDTASIFTFCFPFFFLIGAEPSNNSNIPCGVAGVLAETLQNGDRLAQLWLHHPVHEVRK